MEKMTSKEFKTKYRYYERVSNVVQEFNITSAGQILNDESPEGILKETFYDNATSTYILESIDGDVLVTSNEPSDIINYIQEVLKLEITY